MPWRSKLFRELETRPEDYESILQKADRNVCRLEGAEREKFFEEARNQFPDIYHLTAFNDRGESIEALRARQEELWGWRDQRPAAKKARKQTAAKPKSPLSVTALASRPPRERQCSHKEKESKHDTDVRTGD